jgi:hypothetical protein
MQRLPGVTLLTATSVDIDPTHAAILRCVDQIEFGAVKMLSAASPTKPDPRVQYVDIPPLDFIGYSRFIVEQLDAHVETDHCLIVQADGFILDAARWRPEFLEYDYIGALARIHRVRWWGYWTLATGQEPSRKRRILAA